MDFGGMDDDRANADDGMHALLFDDGGEISREVGWHRRPRAKDLRETDAIFSATHDPIATDRALGRSDGWARRSNYTLGSRSVDRPSQMER